MENPSLTFVTPTTIAGDKSLVDVVAHEVNLYEVLVIGLAELWSIFYYYQNLGDYKNQFL